MFILPAGTEITLELLAEFVDRHKKMVSKSHYRTLIQVIMKFCIEKRNRIINQIIVL